MALWAGHKWGAWVFGGLCSLTLVNYNNSTSLRAESLALFSEICAKKKACVILPIRNCLMLQPLLIAMAPNSDAGTTSFRSSHCTVPYPDSALRLPTLTRDLWLCYKGAGRLTTLLVQGQQGIMYIGWHISCEVNSNLLIILGKLKEPEGRSKKWRNQRKWKRMLERINF